MHKAVDAQKHDTDADDDAEFLADSREDKIGFDKRNFIRLSLPKPRAERPSGADCEKRLCNLISDRIDETPRIQKGLYSLLDMGKKVIQHNRSKCHRAEAPGKNYPFVQRHIGHKNKNHIENQAAAEILGTDQDEHMCRRERCNDGQFFQILYISERARKEQKVQNLYKFRGLKSQSEDRIRDICAKRCRAQQHNNG